MELYVIAGIGAALFVILPLFLKSNAVYMFLLLCVSEIVSKLTSTDAVKIVNSFLTSTGLPTISVVQITILLLAPLIVLLAYKGAEKSKYILFNFWAGLAAAVLFVDFVVAKLPYDLKQKITDNSMYNTVEAFVGVAAVAGLVASFFYILAVKPKHDKESKKHK